MPDFRNLGVLLRVLLLVNLFVVATVLVQIDDLAGFMPSFVALSGRVALPLLVVVLILYCAQPLFARISRRAGGALVAAVVAFISATVCSLVGEGDRMQHWVLWAIAATGGVLFYFDYRNLRLSPALIEARLIALTARIRPHFLFNSLNAVLGVIRSDPKRAEHALEELAELFRVLMRENRELVRLGDEMALCQRYLDLESLRLGDRLKVQWNTEHCPLNALVPPLLLQPLLENAVYHGIEPLAEAGEIRVQLYRRGKELRIEVDNPVPDTASHYVGNRMALDNLRERLMLFFDLEAGLESERRGGRYRVRIRMPYKSATP